MPEPQQSRSQLRGNQCNMTDVMRRISLSKPPVNIGMYRTLYMRDYKPYSDDHQQPHTSTVDLAEKLTLEAQLKAKEFARPIQYEPVKYAEDPPCQEVQPPYPTMMERRWGKGPDAPPVQEGHQMDLHTALPSAQNHLIQHSPPVEWIAAQGKEAERLSQQTDLCAMPDYITGTEASTYQKDYLPWPRVRSGFCRAQRNFSSLLLEDGYYNENPWMSEYMDNYSIFLRKLNWKSRNPVSSFCSAMKPVPHLSHGMPSQTPVAL